MLSSIIPTIIIVLFEIFLIYFILAKNGASGKKLKVITAICGILFLLAILSAIFLIWLNFSDTGRLFEAKDKIRTELRYERRIQNIQNKNKNKEKTDRDYLIRAADELGIPEKDRDILIKRIENSSCR